MECRALSCVVLDRPRPHAYEGEHDEQADRDDHEILDEDGASLVLGAA